MLNTDMAVSPSTPLTDDSYSTSCYSLADTDEVSAVNDDMKRKPDRPGFLLAGYQYLTFLFLLIIPLLPINYRCWNPLRLLHTSQQTALNVSAVCSKIHERFPTSAAPIYDASAFRAAAPALSVL